MSSLTIQFLGTSAARPIPRWGCECPQCTVARTDSRERRTRSAIVVNGTLLVDAGPDVYTQLRTLPYQDLVQIDQVIITHPHADHYLGLDDLAALRRISGLAILPIYALADNWERIQEAFRYLIAAEVSEYDRRPFARRQPGLGQPLDLEGGLRVTFLDTHHTQPFTTAGLLIERNGKQVLYAPDFYSAELAGPVDLAILDGSFSTREQMDGHYAPLLEEGQGRHRPMVEAAEWAEGIGARRVVFTHIGHHRAPADQVKDLLPGNKCELAYDGLEITV